MDRIIFHADANAFYASVEELLRPELKDVPMAVAGNPENRHGIILAKNERAKRFGVQTAETIWQAKRKYPDLVCVPPHHEWYHQTSKEVNKIYLQYTDLVDRFGIDESFLDVTGTLHLFRQTPRELADALRARVRSEIGITISVGVSFCRAIAKLGSDYKKPDATTVIDRDDLARIVWPLPVSALLYAGRKSVETLRQMKIETIGDLAHADRLEIGRRLGKAGDQIWRYANGQDNEPVRSFYAPKELKSVGNGMTFRHDLRGEAEIRQGVMLLADSIAARMRAEQVQCTTVQVQIKDPSFKTIQRQQKLPRPTYLQREIAETAMALIRANWNLGAPIRLITLTGADLVPAGEAHEQTSLFADEGRERHQRLERLEDAMAKIRGKYGHESIGYGGAKGKDI
ncbi:MAG: DNA polymerase IV [Oscillospiraceae bacterium]|nr:DNA polymerase IV [Oscillospiraceae bacterium]